MATGTRIWRMARRAYRGLWAARHDRVGPVVLVRTCPADSARLVRRPHIVGGIGTPTCTTREDTHIPHAKPAARDSNRILTAVGARIVKLASGEAARRITAVQRGGPAPVRWRSRLKEQERATPSVGAERGTIAAQAEQGLPGSIQSEDLSQRRALRPVWGTM